MRRSFNQTAAKAGFTLIELCLVVTIVGFMTMIAYPRLNRAKEAAGVRAANGELVTRVAQARQAAIRRGRAAVFHTAGNKVWVTVDSSGQQVALSDTLDVQQKYGVTMTGSASSVRFNGRGMATLTTSQTLSMSNETAASSVCMTVVGRIQAGGCTL